MNRKKGLYAIAVLIAGLIILGTSGADMLGSLTFFECVWQIFCGMILGLLGCYGLALEETRAARKMYRGRYVI